MEQSVDYRTFRSAIQSLLSWRRIHRMDSAALTYPTLVTFEVTHMTINITMYAVGLGTSILIQFGDSPQQVRVLVDGGNATAGKGVADKLVTLLKPTNSTTESDKPCIDLVIGSHYDARLSVTISSA